MYIDILNGQITFNDFYLNIYIMSRWNANLKTVYPDCKDIQDYFSLIGNDPRGLNGVIESWIPTTKQLARLVKAKKGNEQAVAYFSYLHEVLGQKINESLIYNLVSIQYKLSDVYLLKPYLNQDTFMRLIEIFINEQNRLQNNMSRVIQQYPYTIPECNSYVKTAVMKRLIQATDENDATYCSASVEDKYSLNDKDQKVYDVAKYCFNENKQIPT